MKEEGCCFVYVAPFGHMHDPLNHPSEAPATILWLLLLLGGGLKLHV